MDKCAAAVAVVALTGTLACSPAPVRGDGQTAGSDLTGIWENNSALLPESVRAVQGWAFSPEPPPMTPWAQARLAEARPTFGPNNVAVVETNDPVYDCFRPGVPRIYFHPFPMEIIQLPDRVIMHFEYDNLVRQIYTDGRPHRDHLAPTWMGDPIGYWEGDTLVIESVNFNDKTWIDRRGVPHSDQLRVVERVRRLDRETLQIDITIEDPIAFTEPWTGQRFYRLTPEDWEIEEFSCMDNYIWEEFEREALGLGDDPSQAGSPVN